MGTLLEGAWQRSFLEANGLIRKTGRWYWATIPFAFSGFLRDGTRQPGKEGASYRSLIANSRKILKHSGKSESDAQYYLRTADRHFDSWRSNSTDHRRGLMLTGRNWCLQIHPPGHYQLFFQKSVLCRSAGWSWRLHILFRPYWSCTSWSVRRYIWSSTPEELPEGLYFSL